MSGHMDESTARIVAAMQQAKDAQNMAAEIVAEEHRRIAQMSERRTMAGIPLHARMKCHAVFVGSAYMGTPKGGAE